MWVLIFVSGGRTGRPDFQYKIKKFFSIRKIARPGVQTDKKKRKTNFFERL